MRKILFYLTAFIFVAILASANSTFAKPTDTPRGLEDRGPLDKVTFVHYKRANAKPPWAGGGGGGNTELACYSFLAKGAKWRSVEDFFVNTTDSGLDGRDVFDAATVSASTWNEVKTVLGSAALDNNVEYQTNSVDEKNVIAFKDLASGTIGVTTVWGYFYGPPSTRELVEWDMALNTDYPWGASGEQGKMDLQNIFTHEFGHSVGLGDQYETGCSPVTMFGYSDFGETEKQSLEQQDINGINELYK